MADQVSFGAPANADPGTVLPGTTVDANGNVSIQVDKATEKKEEPKPKERPSWLPEKFKTEEELVKSYQELEKKLGGKKEEVKPVDDKSKEAAKPKEGTEAAEAVKAAGFDFQALEQEYADNEGLSDETYKSLEAKGITREKVDQYIEGRAAVGQQLVATLVEVAGTPEALQDTLEWAKENADPAAVAAYNKAIKSGDRVTAKIIFHSLHSGFAESGGVEPALKSGGNGKGVGTVAPFASRAQMTKAMSSNEYKNDPGFRKEVERRVAATDFAKMA